jgi:hypothetical protein
MRVEGQVRPVDELMFAALNVDRRSDPEIVRIKIDADVKQHLEQFRIGDIDVAPADAARKVRVEFERRHDEQLAADLRQLDADYQATEAALERRLEQSRQPPSKQDDMRELVLYRRWEGRTLIDVARAYAATTDAADPVFVRLIEGETGDIARLFRLQAADDDVAALMRLQEAIRERREQREDADAKAKLATVREWRGKAFRFSYLLDKARKGHPVEIARLRPSLSGGSHVA